MSGIKRHWPEYSIEAVLLGFFMIWRVVLHDSL